MRSETNKENLPTDAETLIALSRLNRDADEALEQAIQDHMPLECTVDRLLSILTEHTGSKAAFVETLDEDFAERQYRVASEAIDWESPALLDALRRPDSVIEFADADNASSIIIQQRLDVAGTDFGRAGLIVPASSDSSSRQRLAYQLDAWCEELDGYLAAIARARKKHLLTRKMSQALKEPLLEVGVTHAVEVLASEIEFDRLMVAYHSEEGHGALHYLVFSPGKVEHRSADEQDPKVRALMNEHGQNLILEGDKHVLEYLGIGRYQEEILINGVQKAQIVGRVIVGLRDHALNTFDRDLLENFADCLRQRIVDFNREWRRLSLCFPRETVERMLSQADHVSKYLTPREESVAVMFCDISGFTRVSEQILKEPARIGALIDTWGRAAVDAIWRTGGVFDKMVGDCVIAIWGPPFFELSPEECCKRAIETAQEIRRLTREIGEKREIFNQVLEGDLGVATGINYGSLFVGQFGPNDDYTGFSAAMNNTARLQGQATHSDILCMDSVVDLAGNKHEFGKERQAMVKNVAEPLRFRSLLD